MFDVIVMLVSIGSKSLYPRSREKHMQTNKLKPHRNVRSLFQENSPALLELLVLMRGREGSDQGRASLGSVDQRQKAGWR